MMSLKGSHVCRVGTICYLSSSPVRGCTAKQFLRAEGAWNTAQKCSRFIIS